MERVIEKWQDKIGEVVLGATTGPEPVAPLRYGAGK